jgi:hypothetical protein
MRSSWALNFPMMSVFLAFSAASEFPILTILDGLQGTQPSRINFNTSAVQTSARPFP